MAKITLEMDLRVIESKVYYSIDYSYPGPMMHAITIMRGRINLDANIGNVTSVKFTASAGNFRAGSNVVVEKIK